MNSGKEGKQLKQEIMDLLGKRLNQGVGEMAWNGQERQFHTPKLETMNQVAGHIAQYFNSIFTVIMGCGGSIQEGLPEHDPLKPYVHQILASSERAALLTRGLLAFTKKQVIHPEPMVLNQLVTSIRRLIQRVVGDQVELRTELNPEDPVVWGDEVQIEQVLMNLAANARDAMPKGGKLTIRTNILTFQNGSRGDYRQGNSWRCAAVSVADTGTGMDEVIKKRIFEPFFTTKGAGKALGLGLSIVSGIIKQHNGSLNVTTEVGKGSTFTLYLPLIARPVIELKSEVSGAQTGQQRQWQ